MVENFCHLWLISDNKKQALLKQITDGLSIKYDAPIIFPHVSLRIRIRGEKLELTKKTKQLAELFSPIALQFKTVDNTEEFYQCVFLKAADSAELQTMRKEAEKLL